VKKNIEIGRKEDSKSKQMIEMIYVKAFQGRRGIEKDSF